MKPTVYIETTIVSYLTARPSSDVMLLSHQLTTQKWWTTARLRFDVYASEFVIKEVSGGDPLAAANRLKVLESIAMLDVSESSEELASNIAHRLRLPRTAAIDAAHVAIAAVSGMSFMLTWNCKHLANAALADEIERTCAEAGYKSPRIVTPDLLMEPL